MNDQKTTKHTVTVTNNATGQALELPVYTGTHGTPVVDTRSMHSKMGMFTYDPGFKSTASCSS